MSVVDKHKSNINNCIHIVLDDDSGNHSELSSVRTGKLNNSDEADTLLKNGLPSSQQRYATSEFAQFWIVLKRTLLFSRRDWVCSFRNNNLANAIAKRAFVLGSITLVTKTEL